MSPRHFLTLLDLDSVDLHAVIARAIELKQQRAQGHINDMFKNKVLGMVFEKSSTRTRVSFESAMVQCGGGAVFLSPRDTQLGRGEPIADTARVLSGMVDIIMVRAHSHDTLKTFAQYSSVPVINALTDLYHPCQLLADVQTFEELRGSIAGRTVAWIGDGYNMCHSYINAARQFDFKLKAACPPGYQPDPDIVAAAGNRVEVGEDPAWAIKDADLIVTDVYASMGHEAEEKERMRAFSRYQVSAELMQTAAKDALFMHCLPAHRGEEVTAEVMDGPQSVVWQEAENRLHSQKALLEFLLFNGFAKS